MKNQRTSHLSVLIVQVNITSASGSENGQFSTIRKLSWPKIIDLVIHRGKMQTAHKWFIWKKPQKVEFILCKIYSYLRKLRKKKNLKSFDQRFSYRFHRTTFKPTLTNKQKNSPSNPIKFCTAAVDHPFHIWCSLPELLLVPPTIDYSPVSAVQTSITQNRMMVFRVC